MTTNLAAQEYEHILAPSEMSERQELEQGIREELTERSMFPPDFYRFLRHISVKRSRNIEKRIVADYKNYYGGESEVFTPVGRVDLLTDAYLFEFKKASEWKHGIGQLLVYSGYFPARSKVLVLFGDLTENRKKLISLHCNSLNIEVLFQEIWRQHELTD